MTEFMKIPANIGCRNALLSLSLIAVLGCSPTGLLYPGDELRENPPGYGLLVIGAEPSIRLFLLEVCSGRSCLDIGPFMQMQEAYLVRLPVGDHCPGLQAGDNHETLLD
jgi:hypothetical protein